VIFGPSNGGANDLAVDVHERRDQYVSDRHTEANRVTGFAAAEVTQLHRLGMRDIPKWCLIIAGSTSTASAMARTVAPRKRLAAKTSRAASTMFCLVDWLPARRPSFLLTDGL
jgi:hypothetical protein